MSSESEDLADSTEIFLHCAAQQGNLKLLEELFSSGADINEGTASGRTVLHTAAAEKKGGEVVNFLLNKGANARVQDCEGREPLHICCSEGCLESAICLIEWGVHVNALDSRKLTPLYMAARSGHFDIVSVLISAGADVSIATKDGDYPLHTATRMNRVSVVHELLKAGARLGQVNKQGCTALHVAGMQGHAQAIAVLLEAGASYRVQDSQGYTPLHSAAVGGKPRGVQLMLEEGAELDPCDKQGLTPLHIACVEGHVDVVNELAVRGANVQAAAMRGQTSLHLAALEGHCEVVRALLRFSARRTRDIRGRNEIHLAALSGSSGMMELLLTGCSPADIHATDREGWQTPLHLAACGGHHAIVRQLCAAGADLEVTDLCGRTPLYLASSSGAVDTTRALLEEGASVSARAHALDRDGRHQWQMVLQCAACAEENSALLLEMLVAAGGAPNDRDEDGGTALWAAIVCGNTEAVATMLKMEGWTLESLVPDGTDGCLGTTAALHGAIMDGNLETVALLVSAGAQLHLPSSDGSTALHAAAREAHAEVLEAIVEMMPRASINATNRWGMTALHVGAAYPPIVSILLENGADPRARDAHGRTALHYAAVADSKQSVSNLLLAGGGIDAGVWGEGTPLHEAAACGSSEAVQVLAKKQLSGTISNLGKPGVAGATSPLHVAAERGHVRAVSALLSAAESCGDDGTGRVLSFADVQGRTPLHCASEGGHTDIVRQLLEASDAATSTGHRWDVPDTDGRTPLAAAAEGGHLGTVRELCLRSPKKGASACSDARSPVVAARRRVSLWAEKVQGAEVKPVTEPIVGPDGWPTPVVAASLVEETVPLNFVIERTNATVVLQLIEQLQL